MPSLDYLKQQPTRFWFTNNRFHEPLVLDLAYDEALKKWRKNQNSQGYPPWTEFLRNAQEPLNVLELAEGDDSGSVFYLFYVEDCFSPPLYVVQADSLEEAYEYALDHVSEHGGCKIEEHELFDYIEDGEVWLNVHAKPKEDGSLETAKEVFYRLLAESKDPSLRDQKDPDPPCERLWNKVSLRCCYDGNGNPVDDEGLYLFSIALTRVDF